MSDGRGRKLDERLMRRALEIGRKGLGRTSPNPPVGAVIARGARIVGEGWHRRAGGPHAEIAALRAAGDRARGATLYCTLEPCTVDGRTPPCAPRLVEAGVARVVVGTIDPNPRVRGRGLRLLRKAGLAVDCGVEEEAARALVRFFAQHVGRRRPFVRLKLAASADGRIATRSGQSRWITGTRARALVHVWRDELDAVLVGIGTVLADDPSLTCRRRGGRDPVRVVIDRRLRMPERARLLREGDGAVWIATAAAHDRRKAERLERRGARLLIVPERRGHLDLDALFRMLGERDIVSVLAEGGGEIAAALLTSGLVDELCWFTAPLVIGGDGIPMLGSLGISSMERALRLSVEARLAVGDDLLTIARPISARRSARGRGSGGSR